MPTRLLILTLLAPLAGCFLALDLSRGGGSRDPDDASDTDTDGSSAVDTSSPTPQATARITPDTVAPGATVVLQVTFEGLAAADVTDVGFGPDVAVTTWRVDDDASLLVAVDVAADAAIGPVPLTLATTRGDLLFAGALTVTP